MDGLNDRPTDGQTDRWKDQQTQKDRPMSLNGTNGFEKKLGTAKSNLKHFICSIAYPITA